MDTETQEIPTELPEEGLDFAGKKTKHDLTFVLDVPLRIVAQLGRVEMTVKELLSLKVGSVMELGKLAGEPLEILLTENLICKGEVIVVNEHYGIRMTDIVKPDNVQSEEE